MTKENQEPREYAERPNKTQLKKEAKELHDLGKSLTELSQKQLDSFPLTDEMMAAILLAQKVKHKREGYRRQLQFIAKLLRLEDVDPIQQAYMKLMAHHQQQTDDLHHLEQMRDELIAKGDEKIQELLQDNPQLDRQKLRQLIRSCQREKQLNKPPKAYREIFQYLKANFE